MSLSLIFLLATNKSHSAEGLAPLVFILVSLGTVMALRSSWYCVEIVINN
jgi:hypothetical protein